MGDHGKRVLEQHRLRRKAVEKSRPAKELPRCHCGAPVLIHVSTRKGDCYYCAEHAHEAEL